MNTANLHTNSELGNRELLTGRLPLPDFGSSPIAVDSMKLRIPMANVKVIDNALNSRWLYVNELTGEIDESYSKDKEVFIKEPGIGIKYKIEKIPVERKVKPFLTMSLPSKILKQNYFEGITINNIKSVYHNIQDHHVVQFSFGDFLNSSSCTDVDLKYDFFYNGDFKKGIEELENLVKETKEQGAGARMFKQKTNQGIEFSNRRTTSIVRHPYLKFYHKGLELMYQSKIFYSRYLNHVDIKDIIRCETTVKNKKHFRRLWGHDLTDLYHVLIMPQEDKEDAFKHAFGCHFNLPEHKRKKSRKDSLKGKDLMLYNLLAMQLNRGVSYDILRDNLIRVYDDRQNRWRNKKLLDSLYQAYKENNNSQVEEFVTWIEPNLRKIFWNAKRA